MTSVKAQARSFEQFQGSRPGFLENVQCSVPRVFDQSLLASAKIRAGSIGLCQCSEPDPLIIASIPDQVFWSVT